MQLRCKRTLGFCCVVPLSIWCLGMLGQPTLGKDRSDATAGLRPRGPEEEARQLYASWVRAAQQGDAKATETALSAWKAVDPEAEASLRARARAASDLEAILRADHGAGWITTAKESLGLLREIEPVSAARIARELFPDAASEAGAPTELERWFVGADLIEGELPLAWSASQLQLGPATAAGGRILGERLSSAAYEIALEVKLPNAGTSWFLIGGWTAPYCFDWLVLTREGDRIAIGLESYESKEAERMRSAGQTYQLKKGEGESSPLRLVLRRRGESLSARVGDLEVRPLRVATRSSRGRIGLGLHPGQAGTSIQITGIEVRNPSVEEAK